MNQSQKMLFGLMSLGAGVLMWLSQPPRRAVWLQFLALTALIFAVSTPRISSLQAAGFGLVFALGYVGPQLIELRLHPLISLVLATSQTLIWTLFALGAARFAVLEPVQGAASLACWGALLMWLEWTLLPLWGTAQSFARGWSRVPWAVQFVSFTGVAGAVWVLCFGSALAARGFQTPRAGPLIVIALSATILALAMLNFALWRAAGTQTLRVATWGWAGIEVTAPQLNQKLHEAIRAAAQQGARLLVTPEAAFQVENRQAFRDSLRALAKRHQIALAIGYFDTARQENCVDFVDAEGEIQGRYVKTHLVPLFETYTRGRGDTSGFQIDGISLGGLICQDDNFADLAGKYGRQKTQILTIPTHDWAAVKNFHFVNSLWRSLEFRVGLVRAATGGISAIVSPRGEVLASCDHFTVGFQLLVADMPLGAPNASFYARSRDWFPVVCALWVLWVWFK